MTQQVPSRPAHRNTVAHRGGRLRTGAPKSTTTCVRWGEAGAEAVLLSLVAGPEALKQEAVKLDELPAHRQPGGYRSRALRREAPVRPQPMPTLRARGVPIFALLEHALISSKPVLAICYGIQSLNVFLGGTLIQDIPTELGSKICHSPEEDELPDGSETPDAMHGASLDPGRVFTLSGAAQAEVNSWHHQSVLEPGSLVPAHHGARTGRGESRTVSIGRRIRIGSWECSGIRRECWRMHWRSRYFAI